MPQNVEVNGQIVEFPDGMSADDIGAAIKKNALSIPAPASAAGAAPAPAREAADPNSPALGGIDNVLSGIGMGMAKVGRGIAGLQSAFLPPTAKMPGAADYKAGLDARPEASAEAARLDAPLASTSGGKFGNFMGQTALAAPAMLMPGANTYPGAALFGGLWGGATEDGNAMDRAKAALYGTAGAVAGKAAGDVLGYGARRLFDSSTSKAAEQAAQVAPRAAAVDVARKAGYVLPPADANPGALNTILQGFSGKIKTAQTASERNQAVTNAAVKNDFGLPADQPISIAALDAVRAKAGQAYATVGNAGTITPRPAYDAALDAITAPYQKAAAGFPGTKPNPIIEAIQGLKSPQFDAGSAISKIGELRDTASQAYAKMDKTSGKAYMAAADAIENELDAHLVASGAPKNVIEDFRNARKTIAQTYTAQKALNNQTGDVNAQVFGQRVLTGKPLGGEGMNAAGQVAAQFPKAMQMLKEAPNQMSPLDFAVGGIGMATGSPVAGLAAARPVTRSVILSAPYQRLMGRPSIPTPSASLGLLNDAANSELARRGLTLGGMGLLSLPADQ